MRMSITAHPHVAKDRKALITALRRIRPTFVRVSSLQREALSGTSIRAVREIIDAGFQVIPVITSDKCGRISDKEWRDYVTKSVTSLPRPPAGQQRVWQIGNEWNVGIPTQPGWNAPPNSRVAFERFRTAVEICRSRSNCCLLWGAVTNETKTKSDRISAAKWLRDWMNYGAQYIADGVTLHYYDGDKHLSTLKSNVTYLRQAAPKLIVAITETGSKTNAVKWYREVSRNGLACVAPDYLAWYCLQGESGFNAMDNEALMSEMAKA